MAERDKAVGRRIRLLGIYTHPIQYCAPLFRTLATHYPEIDFEVLYLTRPTPEQQGQGFGVSFRWDQDLLDGYRWRVFRDPLPGDDYTRWRGLDAPGIGQAIEKAQPDVVLLPGWNCRGLVRALFACNRLRIPVLYRGDTNLWQRPRGLRGILWCVKNRLLLHRFSGFLAVGKRARIFLREQGVRDDQIFDSPHAVDGERIRRDAGDATTPKGRARVRAELGLAEKDFVVLFAGKLETRKRPEDAVRAVAEMGEGAVLAICGAGELEDSCRKVAGETGARVRWLGFRNQTEMPRIYAAVDALVLTSVSETWGLAVNEAMAVGTPCVVSDAVGCAPDLVAPGLTGEIFPATMVSWLVEGLQRMRRLQGPDGVLSSRVRARESLFSLESSAIGITRLATAATSSPWPMAVPSTRSRILALCDGMAFLGGMERRTMEILDYAAAGGAEVHCIINHQPWLRYRIAQRIEQGGHSWSTGRSTTGIFSGERSVKWALRVFSDVFLSSARVFVTAIRRRSRVLFLWSFGSALKNWPALFALRWIGFTVILRSGTAPAPGTRQQWIWRWLVDPVVDVHVANSAFIAAEIATTGVQPRKIRVIRNPLPETPTPSGVAPSSERRIVYVGQVLPEKGILELLDALSLLHQRGVTFEAVVIGRFDGWEHPSHRGHKEVVRKRIAELPRGAVEVLGEREDVLELLQSSAVHCCPSQERQREGLAGVVLQAKAAGIPSVVTPSGALPEMVRHGVDGWICRGFGAEAIAEGLAYFLRDPAAARRAGREAASWRDAAYARETVEREWRSLLSAATASTGA